MYEAQADFSVSYLLFSYVCLPFFFREHLLIDVHILLGEMF